MQFHLQTYRIMDFLTLPEEFSCRCTHCPIVNEVQISLLWRWCKIIDNLCVSWQSFIEDIYNGRCYYKDGHWNYEINSTPEYFTFKICRHVVAGEITLSTNLWWIHAQRNVSRRFSLSICHSMRSNSSRHKNASLLKLMEQIGSFKRLYETVKESIPITRKDSRQAE